MLLVQWEFQDPKMEVLYHIRPYFVGIFPYIGLMYGMYLQFRFLRWPVTSCHCMDLSKKTVYCTSSTPRNNGLIWMPTTYDPSLDVKGAPQTHCCPIPHMACVGGGGHPTGNAPLWCQPRMNHYWYWSIENDWNGTQHEQPRAQHSSRDRFLIRLRRGLWWIYQTIAEVKNSEVVIIYPDQRFPVTLW